MATNLDILSEIKDIIFVEEILSKTRNGGLPWVKSDMNRYSVTICEPPFCLSPYLPGESWTFNVTKLPLGLEYIYALDVLVDTDTLYLQSDSRSIDAISTLFTQIEKIATSNCRIDRAIKFISNIPTAPSTDFSEFVMCGQIIAGGKGNAYSAYNVVLDYGGAGIGSEALPSVRSYPEISGGVEVSGENIIDAIFAIETSGGSSPSGTTDNFVVATQSVEGGSIISGSAEID